MALRLWQQLIVSIENDVVRTVPRSLGACIGEVKSPAAIKPETQHFM
jgi:hypothetical protein